MDTAAPSTLAVLSPERIGVDNGPPWDDCAEQRYTRLCVWLIRLGVRVSHSRAYHPQTLGKDERFQETLNRELISRQSFADLQQAQAAFDPSRECYNLKRPHEALAMQPAVVRYRPSKCCFPEQLPAVRYAAANSYARSRTKDRSATVDACSK